MNKAKHYNSHPSGVECKKITEWHSFYIGNAMKYMWRCGLKESESATKDINKAIDYLKEHLKFTAANRHTAKIVVSIDNHPSGIAQYDIVKHFEPNIAAAFSYIWIVGLGFVVKDEWEKVTFAIKCLEEYLQSAK